MTKCNIFLKLDSIPIFVVSIQHSNSFNSMIISEWLYTNSTITLARISMR